jgi:hypothetical protein
MASRWTKKNLPRRRLRPYKPLRRSILDREFWAQMTGRERVEALEELRAEAWKVTGERVERLRRVVQIVDEPWR